jgi:hypothetical protein
MAIHHPSWDRTLIILCFGTFTSPFTDSMIVAMKVRGIITHETASQIFQR